MYLQTDRLLLRRWKDTDFEPFRSINADPRVMEFYPSTNNAEESDRIIRAAEKHFDAYDFGLFAVVHKHSQRLIGFVGLQNVPFTSHFTPAIEIGWRIAFDFWNQGLATEAAGAVLIDGFSRLSIQEIVAMTVSNNTKSRRVMEKLKMTYSDQDDFENPRILEGHPLRPHVLYRMQKDDFYAGKMNT